jgi:hypothetical protein
MRVFGRALVLGFLVMVCGPGRVAAAPILPVLEDGCALAAETTGCTFYQLESFADGQVTGGLQSELTVFGFGFDEETDFSVETSFWIPDVYNPTLVLFDSDGKILVFDEIPARFFDISPDTGDNLDDQINVHLLADTTYFMALINGYTSAFQGINGQETLADYACERFVDVEGEPVPDCSVAASSQFSMIVNGGDGEPEPVPEPGTLTLMAGGAIAGLIQRRRSKKRNRSESVSR